MVVQINYNFFNKRFQFIGNADLTHFLIVHEIDQIFDFCDDQMSLNNLKYLWLKIEFEEERDFAVGKK
jgi:hypothetical protein